jgi:DNA-3-methyladenine glycosylase II
MFSDPILKKLQKKYPAPIFEDRSERLFERLTESIISQQLSVKAADTIFGRFVKLFKSDSFPTPQQVLKISDQEIRSAGISFRKIEYIKGIAKAFLDKQIMTDQIKILSDEQIIIELTKLKGIGKWTAEMMLIFTFQRQDVFSIGDAGLRRAIQNLYKISDLEEMLKLSENWKPYRSTASWYLWRSLENT